jgi:hypothetical protein
MRRFNDDEREAQERDKPHATAAPVSNAARIIALQRTVGNQAVAAMLAREAAPKQAKPAPGFAVLGGIGTIPLLSASLSSQSGSQSGSKENPVTTHEIVVTSEMGEHSAKLMLASQQGAAFEAEIMLGEKLHLKLHKAMVANFQESGHGGGGDAPVDTWTLNAESIEFITDER